MNICKIVLECIDQYPEDEPIFIEEIKKYVIEKCKEDEKENVLKNINVILNRLKNEGIIKAEYKGVYYKPAICIFGEVPLNTNRLRELKYLVISNDFSSNDNCISSPVSNLSPERTSKSLFFNCFFTTALS